jgi:hypothetical protein
VAKPNDVRHVLFGEVMAELAEDEPKARYEVLEDISRAGLSIMEVMAPVLFEELRRRSDFPVTALAPMLKVLVHGLSENRAQLAEFAIQRFHDAQEAETPVCISQPFLAWIHQKRRTR